MHAAAVVVRVRTLGDLEQQQTSPIPAAMSSKKAHLQAVSSSPAADAGRVATLFEIGTSLKALELQQWMWTITDFLRLYDGLQEHLPAADDPIAAVRRVLATLRSTRGPGRVIGSDVVREIERCSFLRWHTQWVDGKERAVGAAWEPLREPGQAFVDYTSASPAGAVALRVRRLDTMHVEPARLSQWLMAGYLRYVMRT
jgi:hypothetical protein